MSKGLEQWAHIYHSESAEEEQHMAKEEKNSCLCERRPSGGNGPTGPEERSRRGLPRLEPQSLPFSSLCCPFT